MKGNISSYYVAFVATLLWGLLLWELRGQPGRRDAAALYVRHAGHPFSPGGDVCSSGWVLPQINTTMRERVDQAAKAWYTNLPHILRRAYNDASEMRTMGGPVEESGGHLRFDVLMQPIKGACPRLSRIGGEGDGGKLVCALDLIPHSTGNPCIVYSIGSNNNWNFEEDIVRSTPCSVYTFDCTVDGHVPSNSTDRIHFNKICLGERSKGNNDNSSPTFKSLKEIMSMLGHDHITLLKMDIEGYEYDVFDNILSESNVDLPEQISFELHYITQMSNLDWYERARTAGEMALVFQKLYEAGYRVISREDNTGCKHCSEFTIVRFYCPTVQ